LGWPTRRAARQAILAAAAVACGALTACGGGKGADTLAGATASDDLPIVETTGGAIRGRLRDKVFEFRGVPYGADTGGQGRFRPPRPVPAWSGVLDAFENAPMCPQVRDAAAPGDLMSVGLREKGDQKITAADVSEDCLTLKVTTPALDDGARPVMVWLHGGGFAFGGGMALVADGGNLVRKGDIVHVAVNHRLGAFGYFYLADLLGPDYAESGNVGMLDIVLALEWIRDNIAKFGGNPNNVTIYGNSGGGAKVSTLMAMPQARGLFAKAIIQSGSRYITVRDAMAAREHSARAIAHLGLDREKAGELLTMPMERLLEVMEPEAQLRGGFIPVVDGSVLQRQPWSPSAPAESADVPLIVGFSETEPTFMFGRNDPIFDDVEVLRARVREVLGPKADLAQIERRYDELLPGQTAHRRLFMIWADAQDVNAGITQALRRVRQEGAAPVYVYQITFDTPVADGRWHSPHTIELPFIHDDLKAVPSMLGEDVDHMQPLADLMSSMWLSFARTGDPNVPGAPRWDPFDEQRQPVMMFDFETEQGDSPFAERLKLLADIGLYPMR